MLACLSFGISNVVQQGNRLIICFLPDRGRWPRITYALGVPTVKEGRKEREKEEEKTTVRKREKEDRRRE